MNKEIREIQLIELEILKEIDRVCKKNNIEYFLDSGSVLGAVRHKGFIPWDDDIDIGMTRENYEKFLKVASKELKSDYFLQNIQTEKECPQLYTKVKKNNTLYMSWACRNLHIHQGIYVDIVPYDFSLGNEEEINKIKRLNKIFTYKAIPDRFKLPDNTLRYFSGFFLRKLLHYLLIPIPKNLIIKKITKLIIESNKNNTKYLICYFWGNSHLFLKEDLVPVSYLEFEGKKFPVPYNYDKYLKITYGDYMKLPPINEGEGHCIYKVSTSTGNIN